MNKCLNCGAEVENKFCNVTCQNSYRGKQMRLKYDANPETCKFCGKAFPYEKRRNTFCDSSCAAKFNNPLTAKPKEEVVKTYGRKLAKDTQNWNVTKGEMFASRANWQSARSGIRKLAQKVFEENNKKYECAICGYDKHCEIAHVKAVSEFPEDTKLSEINDVNNLIALCPNHHWEYDNGILQLE